jgi:Family of unknown function (DUF6286)
MRIFGRLVAAFLALALLAGSVLVVLEILLAGLGRSPLVIPYDRWYVDALSTPWADAGLRLLLLAFILAGLLLLYLALASRRPLGLPLRKTGAPVDAQITRRSLEQSLARAAQDVDGVSGARVRLSATRAAVTATTNRRVPGDIGDRVRAAVTDRLESLPLADRAQVSVNVRSRSGQ